MATITSMRRTAKNVACNYSDAQVKVREATSNDPWGPSSSLMGEIADMTHNAMAFSDIMQMVWKRLNDHGKNWRHVYKSLVLLDYLIKVGSDKVAQQCKENIYAIQTLKDFQHIEDNKDQGLNVREKAKALVSLLKDEERLKNERSRALIAKKRFAQNSTGISSDGQTHHARQGGPFRSDSELEEARPTSSGEEELQLQIALALSKEEAEKEAEAAKGDDVRLKLALDQSQNGGPSQASDPGAGGSGLSASALSGSAIDDLLALAPIPPPANAAPAQPLNDPWAAPKAPAAPAPAAASADPWAPEGAAAAAPATNDPWGIPASPPPTADPFAPETAAPAAAAPRAMGGGDAWSMEPLMAATPLNGASEAGRAESLAQQRLNSKTPETFLGENSSLVNLDNLMGPSKSLGAAAPKPAASTNPFASGSTGPAATPNPFLAAQRPSPTLSQLQAQNSLPAAPPQSDWSLAQPLQPQPAANNNPNPFF